MDLPSPLRSIITSRDSQMSRVEQDHLKVACTIDTWSDWHESRCGKPKLPATRQRSQIDFQT
jgi:hypothetical protein